MRKEDHATHLKSKTSKILLKKLSQKMWRYLMKVGRRVVVGVGMVGGGEEEVE